MTGRSQEEPMRDRDRERNSLAPRAWYKKPQEIDE